MNDHQELFNNIAKFVADSRSLLQKGTGVELAGLDRQVQSLCAGVMQLPYEDRIKYANEFQDLLNELTALGQDLTVRKEALAHEIRYLSSHKKASVAYQTADAKAPLDPEDN